jgi:hypothetical protein
MLKDGILLVHFGFTPLHAVSLAFVAFLTKVKTILIYHRSDDVSIQRDGEYFEQ